VWEGLGRPERLRPSPVQEELVGAGRLGRKRGHGFYRYDEGRRGPVEPAFAAAGPQALEPALIRARIETAVAAEAERVAADGLATAGDIALALRLGAGHPRSPFAA
jgi:3-hydroxyacyl-CoA dehydrogenase